MNLEDDITNLVLGFFKIIDAAVSEDAGLYKIIIPDEYQNLFQTSALQITFDPKISLKHNCELVTVGSRILSLIVDYCTKRGSIALKKSDTNVGDIVIRYHFFINFSGTLNVSRTEHVDIDLHTCKPTRISNNLENAVFSLQDNADLQKTRSLYLVALDEIKNRCAQMRSVFLDGANKKFLKDYELLSDKHTIEVRDLDASINLNDKLSSNSDDSQEFRFNTVDKIQDMEKDHVQHVEILQEKHKILLEYRLVACEVIKT